MLAELSGAANHRELFQSLDRQRKAGVEAVL